MITLVLLLPFVVAAAILTITPGVDTTMVLRGVAASGRQTAALAALGIALGCRAVGALLRASEVAYWVLKWAGAGR